MPFISTFYDILGEDVLNMVNNFYDGNTLPKSITYTNLVLIRKRIWWKVFQISDLSALEIS